MCSLRFYHELPFNLRVQILITIVLANELYCLDYCTSVFYTVCIIFRAVFANNKLFCITV